MAGSCPQTTSARSFLAFVPSCKFSLFRHPLTETLEDDIPMPSSDPLWVRSKGWNGLGKSVCHSAIPARGVPGRVRKASGWRLPARVSVVMEATGGLEPPIEVLQTSALTTWLRRPVLPAPPALQVLRRSVLVPRAGFEPTQAIAHGPLKTACLPIPPPRPS